MAKRVSPLEVSMLPSRLVFASVLLAAGCAVQTPSSPGASPSAGPTPSIVPTPTPVPVGTCPTDSPMTVRQFVDADPSCAIGTDVEIRGWLDAPPAIGFEPPGIEPSWLNWFGGLSFIYETGPDGICGTGGGCAGFAWSINPASGLELTGPPRWLIVRGHLDDPVAQTCRFVYPEDWTDERRDDAEAVETCRYQFVIVEFRDAP
jgi:hypothetical protein